MAERAHPELPGFRRRFLGLVGNRYRTNLHKRYGFCKPFVKDKLVLDVPCGVGWGTSMLKGARMVLGLDISRDAVAYGSRNYKTVILAVGDMARLPFPDKLFDVVICLEGLEHVPPAVALQFLDEAKRVLVPDGCLVVTCPVLDDRAQPTGNPYHLKEYDHQELVAILNASFRIWFLERFQGPDGDEIRAVCKKAGQRT